MKGVEKRVRCACGALGITRLRADEPDRVERAWKARRWERAGKRWRCPRCATKAKQPTDAQRADALAAELALLAEAAMDSLDSNEKGHFSRCVCVRCDTLRFRAMKALRRVGE